MDPGNQLRQPWRAPGSASSSSRDGGDSSSSHRGYHGSVHNPAKRVRNGGGLAYRDDETTGYEDDGSEQAAAAAPRWNGNASMGNNSKNRQAMGVLNGLNPLGMKTTNTYASPSTLAAGAHAGLVHGSSRTGLSSETYWTCMWRKPQAKKHKTWESDGILVVENGTKVSLRDKDNSSIVAKGNVAHGTVFADAEFSIGGRDVLVDAEFPAKQYLDGSCFGKGISAMVQQGTGAAIRAPTTSASSFYGSRPSAGPKKFVAPSMTIPRESAYSTTKVGIPPPPPASLAPSAADSFYGDTENSIAHNARFPGGMGYRAPGVTSKTAAATNGLGKAPPAPKSLHDPMREGAVVMKRPDEQHEKMYNKKGYPVVDVVIDPHIGNRLREHQKEGVKFMYEAVMGMKTEGQGCILADDMGLGKTIQSIALMHTLLKQSPYFGERSTIQRVLIACPVTLVNNWAKEITKWLGRDRLGVFAASGRNDIKNFARNRNYHVLIIGYEKLRTVVDELKNIQPPIGLIICDEGHRLKSAGAKTTQALHSFNVKRRIILSGTPIQNELSEFHAMVDFVNPGLLDSYNTFKKTFEQPILKAREPRCPPDAKELGEARSEALQRITKLFVLRRLSDIIANYLPSKAEYVVFVAPTPIQIKFYQHVIGSDQVKNTIRDGRNGLILIDLLRKICNTPGLLLRNRDDGANHMELVEELMQVCPIRTQWTDIALSGKLLAVKAILDSLKQNTDEKVVIVSSFVQTLNILEQMCLTSRFSACRLDGATKQCDRQDIVDGFNKSSQLSTFVFLLSSKAGGTGLNIIGASRLILFDSDWNPSNDLQAMARIHREGQKRKCVIYRLLTKGTMDEKIYQRQITKTGLAGSLMDDGGGMSKEAKGKDAFTTKDLRDIFTLHTDTNCQTHDLLECSCADGEVVQPTENDELLYHSDGGMSSDSDDGNDSSGPDRRSFMKASQYQPSEEQEAKAQKKLQALKEYTHIDCGLSTAPESAIDGIEDDVLRVVAEAGLEALREGVSRKWNAARQYSPDDNDGEASTAVKAAYRGPTYEGGEISFVFHKKTNKPTKATTEATIE